LQKPFSKKMSVIKKYLPFIGIIIFILIIFKIDIFKLFRILSDLNYFYLILAYVFVPAILFVKAYRWNYLKKKQKIIYNLKNSFLMYCAGTYIGILTPGRLGELSKIAYLKNNQCSIGKASVSVLLDRLADLFSLLILSFLGMFAFFYFFQNIILTLIFGIIFISILTIILLRTNLIYIFLKKIFNILIPKKYQKSWRLNYQDFINDLKKYRLKNYLFVCLITLVSWLIYYYQIFFLAKSMGINNISFFYLAITVTIAAFITLLPISILGLGTREAVLILLLSVFQISQEQIISFSFLILSLSIISGLTGLICWLIKPIKILGN